MLAHACGPASPFLEMSFDAIGFELEALCGRERSGSPQPKPRRVANVRITGIIPAKLSDFKIDPPSLLGMAVKNDVPIQVDLRWKPQ